MRVRKSISFKEEVFNAIERERGPKDRSRYINEVFEDKFRRTKK